MQLLILRGAARRVSGRVAALLLAVAAASASGAAPVSAAVKLEEMVGYWTGTGKVQLSNGSTESVKCVVTYKVSGQQLRQNVRCAGQGFSFNGTAELTVAGGGGVTGKWTENTYSASGDVVGKATDRGFSLSISGATFTAVMDVTTTACKQSMSIVPTGLEVSRISLGLGKC